MGEEMNKTYYLFRKNEKYILIDNEDDILDDISDASMGHEMAIMVDGDIIPQATFKMASNNPKIICKMRNHVRNNTLLEKTIQHDDSNKENKHDSNEQVTEKPREEPVTEKPREEPIVDKIDFERNEINENSSDQDDDQRRTDEPKNDVEEEDIENQVLSDLLKKKGRQAKKRNPNNKKSSDPEAGPSTVPNPLSVAGTSGHDGQQNKRKADNIECDDDQLIGKGPDMMDLGQNIFCEKAKYETAISSARSLRKFAEVLVDGVFKDEALLKGTLSGHICSNTPKKKKTDEAEKSNTDSDSDSDSDLEIIDKKCLKLNVKAIGVITDATLKHGSNKNWIPKLENLDEQAKKVYVRAIRSGIADFIGKLKREEAKRILKEKLLAEKMARKAARKAAKKASKEAAEPKA